MHLYGRGQSRRGPAFKVPLAALLEAKCHTFVKRFMANDMPESPRSFHDQFDDLDQWNELNPNEQIEIYIPAPPMADKEQAFAYHLATRNFFAWIFRRSVVGEHLGSALIGLMNSMSEFRGNDQNNVPELISYLDEEGYMDVKGQPHHALALLHLSEFFQLKDMYIDAFTHCVGMGEELSYSPEFEVRCIALMTLFNWLTNPQHISSISRTLIRRARIEMNERLSRTGFMLETFLEDELSETNLGLSTGGRAHMERFRSFVRSFYKRKLGHYPPLSPNSRSTIFEPRVLSTMSKDFKAVYELLVDEGFTLRDSSPPLAQGGICAVQSVHDFDQRCGFQSLRHPLPLLPETTPDVRSARRKSLPWLATNSGRGDKLKPDQRLVAHSALIKAMNMQNSEIVDNDFVRAYRKFEEDSISPLIRVDKAEKISLVDARKVRWIFIYAVHQVLQSCTRSPPEVRDPVGADYHLAISTEKLPPWKEGRNLRTLLRRQTDGETQSGRARSVSVTDWASSFKAPPSVASPTIDIRPDIDHVAKSRRDELRSRRQSTSDGTDAGTSKSRSRSLSRSSPFRRSLGFFRKTDEEIPPMPLPRKVSYCEIVVHGYGNGTNAVKKEEVPDVPPLPEVTPKTATAPRSYSTSSESSGVSDAQSAGGLSFATADSTAPPTSPDARNKSWPNQNTPVLSPTPLHGLRRVRDVLSFASSTYPSAPESSNRHSSVVGRGGGGSGGNYANDYVELVKQQQEEFNREEMEPMPLQIRKSSVPVNFGLSTPRMSGAKSEWELFMDMSEFKI